MSLLDYGNWDIIVYPEEMYIDSDGNKMMRASSTGIPMRATIQPLPQSGTSARRAEQDNEGFESEELYRLRFRRSEEPFLGNRALIEWRGGTWSINGFPNIYRGSSRTAHLDYVIKRA